MKIEKKREKTHHLITVSSMSCVRLLIICRSLHSRPGGSYEPKGLSPDRCEQPCLQDRLAGVEWNVETRYTCVSRRESLIVCRTNGDAWGWLVRVYARGEDGTACPEVEKVLTFSRCHAFKYRPEPVLESRQRFLFLTCIKNSRRKYI